MKTEELMNEKQQSNHMAYESPACNVIELQSEGSILAASTGGSLDDMPIDDWDSLYY